MFAAQALQILGNNTYEPPTDSPTGLGEGIEIDFLHDTWRVGTQDSFVIRPPTGYTVEYNIFDENFVFVKNGTTTSVIHTFTQAMKIYHIQVIVRKGALLEFERWWCSAIKALPPLFTEVQANLVIDFSSGGVFYRDNNLVDRQGWKIYCKGVYNGANYLGLEEWISTNPNAWVHFLGSPGTVVELNSSGPYCIRFNQNNRRILWDGCGDHNVRYGFKFTMPGTGTRAQIMYIEVSTNAGSTPATAGTDIWILGCELDGNTISSAGVKVDTANSATLNWDTVMASPTNQGALKGLVIARMKIKRTRDEAMYVGYVSDSPHGSPAYISCPIIGARFFDIICEDSGGDSFQLGASIFKGEMGPKLQVFNAGTRNDPSHKNGVQFSSGNDEMAFFQNRVWGCRNLQSIATGLRGGSMDVFANVFRNPTVDGSNHINVFLRVDQNDQRARIAARFFNNTYDLAENRPFEGWNAASTGITTKLDWVNVNNAIVCDTLQAYGAFNNIDTSTWVFGNYQVTNPATPKFKDYANGDYRPLDLTSPLFQGVSTVTSPHAFAGLDQDGYRYNILKPIKGAYAGIHPQT